MADAVRIDTERLAGLTLALTRDGMVRALRPVRYDPERAIRGMIADLAAEYDNRDDFAADCAVAAARAGRAAFWKRTQYHNAVVGLVCNHANVHGLTAALAYYADERHPQKRRSAIVAELVALNIKANVELADARHAALWAEASTRNPERVA